MMIRALALGLYILCYAPIALSSCDLTHFRWGCELPLHPNPSRAAHSLVYCGNTLGYLTLSQYNQLIHYQRANAYNALMINGEYVDSPCIGAGRFGSE